MHENEYAYAVARIRANEVNLLTPAVRNACKGEGELRLSKADLDRVPSGFVERINAELKDGSVKLAAQGADIENGFILVYGDIEINCTFRALINEQKDTIREKVCGVIF